MYFLKCLIFSLIESLCAIHPQIMNSLIWKAEFDSCYRTFEYEHCYLRTLVIKLKVFLRLNTIQSMPNIF